MNWVKGTRACPKCNIAHEWTPFCPLCGYEYKSTVIHETATMIASEMEDEPETFMEETSATKKFFDANPGRKHFMRAAGPTECARYDARRPPERRIKPDELLIVLSRKRGAHHFESLYTPVKLAAGLVAVLQSTAEPPEDICKNFWEVFYRTAPLSPEFIAAAAARWDLHGAKETPNDK